MKIYPHCQRFNTQTVYIRRTNVQQKLVDVLPLAGLLRHLVLDVTRSRLDIAYVLEEDSLQSIIPAKIDICYTEKKIMRLLEEN